MDSNSGGKKASNRDRGVARGGSISDRGKNEEKKYKCQICRDFFNCETCKLEEWKKRHVQYEISDDDFVENPYGFGLKKKKVDPEPPASDDKFVPCTGKATTSSAVTDPDQANSDDDFVPCTFKARCKK